MDDEEDEITSLYNHALACTDELLDEHEGLAVAGVLAAISLSLYKSLLNSDEYYEIVDKIHGSADEVKPFVPVDVDEIKFEKKYLN